MQYPQLQNDARGDADWREIISLINENKSHLWKTTSRSSAPSSRAGDAAILQKWKRCSAQLPVTSSCLAQVSWTETRLTHSGAQTGNLTICSVITTLGAKVPPCRPRAERDDLYGDGTNSISLIMSNDGVFKKLVSLSFITSAWLKFIHGQLGNGFKACLREASKDFGCHEDRDDINLMMFWLIIHNNYGMKWTLKWILWLLTHTHTTLHRGVYVKRDISLLLALSLVWILPPPPPPRYSLRGAVKMTTFHHLLFELLLWELLHWFFIHIVATEKKCDHICVETRKCARQMSSAGFSCLCWNYAECKILSFRLKINRFLPFCVLSLLGPKLYM